MVLGAFPRSELPEAIGASLVSRAARQGTQHCLVILRMVGKKGAYLGHFNCRFYLEFV